MARSDIRRSRSASASLLVALAVVYAAARAFVAPAAPRTGPAHQVGVGGAAGIISLLGALPAFAEEADEAAPAAAEAVAEAAPAAAETASEVAGAAGAAAEAAPAAAEGFLNFGKIPLGGGFAINLDIPETGIVNIVVLIGGLLYLLAPLLSESMAAREKEIQMDIDDAIAKFNEATERLAEAEKNRAQANEVIAEIEASIQKDQREFEATIKASTKATLDKQAKAAEAALKELEANAEGKVEAFIREQAVTRGLTELSDLTDEQKSKFMDAVIDVL